MVCFLFFIFIILFFIDKVTHTNLFSGQQDHVKQATEV